MSIGLRYLTCVDPFHKLLTDFFKYKFNNILPSTSLCTDILNVFHGLASHTMTLFDSGVMKPKFGPKWADVGENCILMSFNI